ncbi:MAG: tetratricopeptide repeat protein, partial [Prevotella sp.]|nr:tetratricopeptide repeat protein [Prevotella sp.]
MKKLKTIALLTLLSVSSAFAQDDNSVRNAINALQGISNNMSHEEAITILTSYATNDTNAVAMNALGNVYASGIGTDMDMNKAVHWYEMAAANGMLIAYHNLGMIFKNATNGVEQDFTKACSYFSKGAAEGSAVCNYNYGFMLYKGLGCNQDYGKAVECFKKAAANKHAASLYMLGLCYRNGYGVDADNGVAKDYLVQSANLGHNDAIDELLRPEPENIGLTGDDIINDSLPQAMPQVEAGF